MTEPVDPVTSVQLERRRSLSNRVLTPVAAVAAVGAATASFVDGVTYEDLPKPLPWYALHWDILYYVERGLVLFALVLVTALVVTIPLVERRWSRAYSQISGPRLGIHDAFINARVAFLARPTDPSLRAARRVTYSRLAASVGEEVLDGVNEQSIAI
jgi:hypothetical protein